MSINILRPTTFPKPFQSFPHIGQQWPVYNIESDQADGLVAWWPTLAGFGFESIPEPTHKFNGRISVATWTHNPIIGPILDYSGSDNAQMDVSQNALLDITGDLSITSWVQTGSLNQTDAVATLISKQVAAANPKMPYQFVIRDLTGLLRFVHGSGVADYDVIDSTDAILADTVYLLIITRNTRTSQITFYINGVQDSGGLQAYTATPTAEPSIGPRIGRHPENNKPWNGIIGDTRLYNRVLSPIEATAHYDPTTRWELYTPPKRLFFVPAAAASFPWPSPKSHPNRNVLLRL